MAEYCVTGANGLIASYLIKTLLERGCAVRATVRDPDAHGGYQKHYAEFVHVEDVADAHVLAMEERKSSGHLICSSSVAHWCDIVQILCIDHGVYICTDKIICIDHGVSISFLAFGPCSGFGVALFVTKPY